MTRGKEPAITGEVLPRAPRRARRTAPVDDVVTVAALVAQVGLPIYAATVADTGTDPPALHARWSAATAAWAAALTGWCS